MNAQQLHRLMQLGVTASVRQIAEAVGENPHRIQRLMGELNEAGLVEPCGITQTMNNRAGGTKPLVWRATRARVLTEAA